MAEDHDLLVQLARDVKHLCRKYESNHDQVRQDIKEVHNRIDEQAKGCKITHDSCSHFFVPRYVFYWAVILTFFAVSFVGGVALTNQSAINTHKGYSTEATKRIDSNLDYLNRYILHPDDTPDFDKE